MKSERQIRDMLDLIEKDDELHTIIIKDVGIEEIKTMKDVLRWILDEEHA